MPLLYIYQQPVSESKAVGSNTSFTVLAKSEEPYDWHWEAKSNAQAEWSTTDEGTTLPSGSFIHMSDSAVYGSEDPLPNVDPDEITLSIPVTSARDGHIYRCVLVGSTTVTSDEVVLTVTNGVELVSWADGTDEQIAAMLDAAAAGAIDLQQDAGWKVGDVRSVPGEYSLNAGFDYETWHYDLVITSFDEYMGCGNVLQFDFGNITHRGTMNNNSKIEYGYQKSWHVRRELPESLGKLSKAFQNRLKTFDLLWKDHDGNIQTVSGNKIALRSEREIFGTGPAEGTQLDYYKNVANRIKKWPEEGQGYEDYGPDPKKWFLRTLPSENDATVVLEDGTLGTVGLPNVDTNGRAGFAPFGCLGGYEGPYIAGPIEINEENFPDENFRAGLSTFADLDKDGYLSHYEIENFTSITSIYQDANGKYIDCEDFENTRTFKGIEKLVCLTFFQIYSNSDKSDGTYMLKDELLDLTSLPRLKYFCLYYAAKLQKIIFNGENLEQLRIEYCRKFETVEFVTDPLKLWWLRLSCLKFGIRDFDATKCVNLKYMELTGNPYRAIDIRNNPRLLLAYSAPQNVPRLTWEYGIRQSGSSYGSERAVKTRVDYNYDPTQSPIHDLYPEDGVVDSGLGAEYILIYDPETNIITGDIELTVPPEDAECWENEQATFYCAGTSDKALSYAWERENAFGWDPLGTGQTLSFIPTEHFVTYIYRCKIYQPSSRRVYYVEDQNGKNPRNEYFYHHYLYTDQVYLKIFYPVKIKEQPKDVVNIIGSVSTFIVNASNDPPVIYDEDDDIAYHPDQTQALISYQWQYLVPGDEEYTDMDEGTTSTINVIASEENKNYKYRCKVSDGTNELISNEVRVIVVDNLEGRPSILKDPESLVLMDGTNGTFEVECFGDNLSYQWQASTDNGESWTDIRYATSPSYEVLASLGMNGTKYRCKAYNDLGEDYSEAALLEVYPDTRLVMPSIDSHPSSISVTENSSATFSVVATGDNLSYQWQINQNGTWYSLNGATLASYTITAAKSLNGAQYRCLVSNTAGSVYSNSATLIVTSESAINTPSISSQPRSITIAEGIIGNFRVIAKGGELSYQWQVKRGSTWYDITGATSNILSVRASRSESGTQYRCQVSNAAGAVYSTVATLTVTESGPLPMYGYHSIIISGKNTYGEWEMYPTSRPHVAPPEVKTSYVDVPGADGGLDYTELLNGVPNYGYRKGSWEFLLIPQERWPDVYRSLCSYLHGREHTIVLEDDPTWQYTGRLSVNEWRSAAHNSLIVIDYILDPIAINTEDEEYDPDESDLDAAGRILRKPGNEDSAIILWNGVETVVPMDSLFDDGDSILY